MIAVGVHIGSKGCGDRYYRAGDTRETSRAASCRCPAGRCWVTEARACHERGEPAPELRAWREALEADGS